MNLEGEPSAHFYGYATTLAGFRKVSEVTSDRASEVRRRDVVAGNDGLGDQALFSLPPSISRTRRPSRWPR